MNTHENKIICDQWPYMADFFKKSIKRFIAEIEHGETIVYFR